ncbi:hypothetical protein NDU88_003255 [Pleurodeles waltl]|uniref:Peptidase A2 domain-containing protein n=1 Tax=Pleurodeles waltl TaxID=8319 RepID=A0AAV7W4T3_PLEWA|nr:hypothetical protein NDU88_003255 [Pleurodeles waltl]
MAGKSHTPYYEGQAKPREAVQDVSPGDRRPYVPLIIYWQKGTQHVMALLDTGAEATLINGNPKRLPGKSVIINGYGGAETEAKAIKLKLSIGKGPPFTAEVLMAEVPEYIIGIDLLLGKTIETQRGIFAFGVRNLPPIFPTLSLGRCRAPDRFVSGVPWHVPQLLAAFWFSGTELTISAARGSDQQSVGIRATSAECSVDASTSPGLSQQSQAATRQDPHSIRATRPHNAAPASWTAAARDPRWPVLSFTWVTPGLRSRKRSPEISPWVPGPS